ncbi:hypothetical protein K438DRAFT_396581 [Mycena galopus ATCC 62051]|nr:hypothetical protein K438DRAFT_396581 [Mycena galopus ATCC 62051]
MLHNRSASTSSIFKTKRMVPISIDSLRRALDVSRFESSQHRRKRLEAARSNDLAPIYSLPPELLCHIFLFCATASWIPLLGTSGLGWLTITHVSRRWREVAAACPELWGHIILRRKLVPIMLVRAKDVPLLIRVDLDNNKHLKPQHIRENIARVGLLDVRGSQGALDTFFIDYVGKFSAPRLRSLSVANTTKGDPLGLWLDAGVFGTEGRRNSLPRQLRLEKCALPWNSLWYSNLTDLYLADLHKEHGPTINMLLSVITASPLLQHLTLLNTRTKIDHLDMYRDFPFPLPDLRTIHLSGPVSFCAHVLTNLTFPSIVTVVVASTTHNHLIDTVLSHRDFWKGCHVLRIDATLKDHLRIDASSPWTDKTLQIDVGHLCRDSEITLGPLLYTLMTSRGTFIAWLTTLDICNVIIRIETWRHLCKCRHLTTLIIRGTADPLPVLGLLFVRSMRRLGVAGHARPDTMSDSDIGDDGAYKELFPKLECVHLDDIDCGAPETYPGVTDVLRSLLWARRASRCPIPRVRLENCKKIFQQDVDHLRFLTQTLTWDNVGKNPKQKEDNGLGIPAFSLNVFEHLQHSGYLR